MADRSNGGRAGAPVEVRFADLLAELKRARWLLVGAVLLCGLSALALSTILPDTYEARVVLSAASPEQRGGSLSGLTGSLGGLASLAGISVGGDGAREEALAALQSDALTRAYIEDNNLLPLLYAGQWDAEKHEWIPSRGSRVPTLWLGARKFARQVRQVSSDARSGLVVLTVHWTDPRLAAEWANGLVSLVNEHQRARALAESERRIAYLNDEALRAGTVEARQAVYALLGEEINTMMLIRGRDEYSFRVIDPAVVPEEPYSPRPMLWTVVAALLGLLVGAFIVVLRLAVK